MDDPRIAALASLRGGAVEELWAEAMRGALASIDDPNTDAKAKRTITLKVVLAPSEDRTMAHTTIECLTKFPAAKPAATMLFLGRDQGEHAAVEAPQQADMFQTPTGRPKPVEPPAAGGEQ